jgi:ABC-type sugar transport systems, permease components
MIKGVRFMYIKVQRSSSPLRNKSFKLPGKEDITGFLFVTPMLLGILTFVAYPMIKAFLLSLQRTNGITGSFIGLRNYAYILNDSNFTYAIVNTIILGVLTIVANMTISFIAATLIHNVRFMKNAFKSIYFVPNIISVVSTSILFVIIMYPTNEGLLNYVLGFLKINPVGWFSDPAYSRAGVILMGMWASLGYYMLIFLSGLQGVPRELYEASEVDGSTKLQNWLYITIPYMKPIFVFLFMVGTISAMKRFGDVWMIGGTAGNPGGSLMTVVLYIYRNAFLANEVGLASASSYVLFVIILFLSLLNNKFLNKSNVD